MTDTPTFFNDNHLPEEQEKTVSASLDISYLPAGQYYFNNENNYNYTLNWFNYRKFCTVSEYSTIGELVQYSRPDVLPYSMNVSTKDFMIPASNLTPSWAAHIEAGFGPTFLIYDPFPPAPLQYMVGTTIEGSLACAGMDKDGNQYVITNLYARFASFNVSIFNQSNNTTPALTVPNWNEGTRISSLVKYNPSGNVVWASRIRTNEVPFFDPPKQVESVYCTTDKLGFTYVMGNFRNQDTSVVVFEQPDQTPIITLNMGPARNFLVCYNPLGVPVWATYFDRLSRGSLWIDNLDPLGNVYVQGINSNNSSITFYDGVTSSPVSVLTIPAGSSVVLAKFRSSTGIFQWATYLSGFRVGMFLDVGGFCSQTLTTDSVGDVYMTGSYTYMNPLVHAASAISPSFENSGIELPISTPLAWVPREEVREWTAIDVSATGQYMVATVQGGYVYVSIDYGSTWVPTLIPQNWSCAYCNASGVLLVAASRGGIIYRSADQGNTWEPSTGAGGLAQNWIALQGNAEGTVLVAAIENGQLARSTTSGQSWTFVGTTQNWVDVAYNGFIDTFVAVIEGGKAYRSVDQGATWSLIVSAPTANWSSIASVRTGDSNSFYDFYATVYNGGIYGVSGGSSETWTLIESTSRQWSDIAVSPGGTRDNLFSVASLVYAAVFDGAMYQSTGREPNSWFPTTIPFDWASVAISANAFGQVAAGVVRGGQIYIATNSYPQLHTYLVKYSSLGRVLWATYVNCEEVGDNEGTALVYSAVNNQIILSGRNTKSLQFYDSQHYDTPIKTVSFTADLVPTNRGPRISQSIYLAAYSIQGVPLWDNNIQTAPFFYTYDVTDTTESPPILKQLTVDSKGAIYGIGYHNESVFKQPGGSSVRSIILPDTILVKYYPNGYFESLAPIWMSKLEESPAICNTTWGCSIGVVGDDVFVAGYFTQNYPENIAFTQTDESYALSMPTSGAQPVNNALLWGVYVTRYLSSTTIPFGVPEPSYNDPFQPQFLVGGSRRVLEDGLVGDYPIEPWSARTGLTPSSLSVADLQAGVISYLGHRPGYTRSLDLNGQPIGSSINYRYLTLGLQEPSLPQGDPQPVSPGSVPYGYIPIFLTFPAYVTGVHFNTILDSPTSFLTLIAEGPIPSSGLSIQGCESGDALRLLIITASASFYFDVTVQRLISSDAVQGQQVAIEFTQTLLQAINVLGSLAPSTTYFIPLGTPPVVPAFYRPPLVDEGVVHVVLQTYQHTTL